MEPNPQDTSVPDDHSALLGSWSQRIEVDELTAHELLVFSAHAEELEGQDEIITLALETARQLLGVEVAAYFSPGEARLASDSFVLSGLDAQAPDELRVVLGRSIFRPDTFECTALQHGFTVWTENYRGGQAALPIWAALGLKVVMVTPVGEVNETLGWLAIMDFGQASVKQQHRSALEALATCLGKALKRVRLEAWLRGVAASGWPAVGLALEEEGLEPSGHTEQVMRLAVSLGQAMGLNVQAIEELRQGALLHDIGKMALPRAILLKAGPLDALEWSVIRTHPVRGAKLAARALGCSNGALAVIRHHHEHWNGLGYPHRLAGDAIPLEARIFAVCDVYDTLLSKRPYGRPWGGSAALAEIQARSGSQFDPEVVETFLNLAMGQPFRVPFSTDQPARPLMI